MRRAAKARRQHYSLSQHPNLLMHNMPEMSPGALQAMVGGHFCPLRHPPLAACLPP